MGVSQTPAMLLRKRGHLAQMDCIHDHGGQYYDMYWYRQLPWESMRLMAYTAPFSKPDFGIYNEKNFSANKTAAESGSFTVKDAAPGDSGVYFCVVHTVAQTIIQLPKNHRTLLNSTHKVIISC